MRKALFAILPVVLGAASACASAQAKAPNDKPALDVPPPPPHVIALPAEPLEPVGEVPGTSSAANPGTTTRSARPSPKPEPRTAEPPKTDTPPATAAPDTPAPAPPPTAPAPQLTTPQTADTSAAAKVRATIDRAKNTLGTVNVGPLSNERKKAYHDAELSIQQSEDALKVGNLVFAQAMASKAETLAHELAGR